VQVGDEPAQIDRLRHGADQSAPSLSRAMPCDWSRSSCSSNQTVW
jgi:hypothetical protein